MNIHGWKKKIAETKEQLKKRKGDIDENKLNKRIIRFRHNIEVLRKKKNARIGKK
jgi:hypothetical protein